jgi:GNAT superfamily N-acetyltransferase
VEPLRFCASPSARFGSPPQVIFFFLLVRAILGGVEISFRVLSGAALGTDAQLVAELRVLVFREYPYLYEGNMRYERKYLASYAECARARVILAFHGENCVGASTVMPLEDCEEEVKRPFREHGMDLRRIDYFGESVVKQEFRGRGVGVRFFEERERHAREYGFSLCAFCAVDRASDDPRRPVGYVPNDEFWARRGYTRRESLKSRFSWPDLGEPEASEKTMTYYLKELAL